MQTPILGIDLGTTYSAAAYIDPATDRPVAIETSDGDGAFTLASVVALDQGNVRAVGDKALSQWMVDPEHVIRWVKRAMGNPDYRFQGRSAVEISAEILKVLKADAERHFKAPVTRACITCPAYFGATEIAATLEAGRLAGLDVQEIIKEPTAAAVFFGVDHLRDGERVAVCDLGGGTYDATILHYDRGTFVPLATHGDRQRGGHDFTMALVEIVQGRFFDQTGVDVKDDLHAGQVLYELCERAKRDFARVDSVTIHCAAAGAKADVQVQRGEFEAATEWMMQHLVDVTSDAVAKAKLTWKDVQRILLVGGSSRLRRMGPALKERTGIDPEMSQQPDLSVAFGAAILAAGKVRPRARPGIVARPTTQLVVHKRIIARSLGTRSVSWNGDQPSIVNALIIPHSTEVPETGLSKTRNDFAVGANGQPFVDVPVVEFESDQDFLAVRNFRFTIPPGSRRGEKVAVTFHYDKNTIITVAAHDSQGRSLPGTEVPYVEPDLGALKEARRQRRLVVFLIDTSGSMSAHGKLTNAQHSTVTTARAILGSATADSQVAVIQFCSSAAVLCHPTSDLKAVEAAVGAMSTSGSTAMDQGFLLAQQLVQGAPPDTRLDVVVLTDGMPDSTSKALATAQSLRTAGVNLYAIGAGKAEVDEAFLQQLSTESIVVDVKADFSVAMCSLLTVSGNANGTV